jgi:hypothetical protein
VKSWASSRLVGELAKRQGFLPVHVHMFHTLRLRPGEQGDGYAKASVLPRHASITNTVRWLAMSRAARYCGASLCGIYAKWTNSAQLTIHAGVELCLRYPVDVNSLRV